MLIDPFRALLVTMSLIYQRLCLFPEGWSRSSRITLFVQREPQIASSIWRFPFSSLILTEAALSLLLVSSQLL